MQATLRSKLNRSENLSEGKREFYKGMPVTTMAIILPFLYHESTKGYLYLFVLIGASIAFLLPTEIKKPNMLMKLIMLAIGLIAFFKVLMVII